MVRVQCIIFVVPHVTTVSVCEAYITTYKCTDIGLWRINHDIFLTFLLIIKQLTRGPQALMVS